MSRRNTGSVYPVKSERCAHCVAQSSDDRRHVGSWQAQVLVAGRLSRRNAPTKTAATALLDRIRIEQHTGTLIRGRSDSLAAYVSAWLDARDPLTPFDGTQKHEHQTVLGYRRRAAYLLPTIGRIQLPTLEPDDVRAALRVMSERGYSKTTISDTRVFLAQVLNTAMLPPSPKVRYNAAAAVASIKRDTREKYVLDQDEANRFLTAARDLPRYYSAMLAAVHYGPRAGEMWGARWGDVDWDQAQLRIDRSLYWVGADRDAGRARAAHTKDPKTANGRRGITLGAAALRELARHRDAEAKRLGRIPHRGDYIWSTLTGGPVEHRNALRDVFGPICAKAKIPYVGAHVCRDAQSHQGCPPYLTFHGLRHSAATIALVLTRDVVGVSRMLGHASTEFTMDTYGHVLKEQARGIASAMDKAVHG